MGMGCSSSTPPDGLGGLGDERAIPLFGLPERILSAAAFDGAGDLRRHEGQNLLVGLRGVRTPSE